MRTSGRRKRCTRLAAAVAAVAILAAAPIAGARPDSTTGARAPQDAKVVVVEPDGGFDWADAGVGAGAAAGVVLFGAATARIVRSHRHVAAIRPGRA
jgi:hypothetical protein